MASKINDMTSAQLAEYYEGLEQKNDFWYQQTGDGRYDTKRYRYGRIAEAFRAKAELESERKVDIKKRMVNMHGVIDRLVPDKLYTTAEVERMLREVVWW